MIKNKRMLFVILGLGYFGLLLLSSVGNPLGAYPEEAMRYQIPKFIYDNNRLPTLFDSSIYDAKYGFSYAGQPNLPFILQFVVMKISSLLGVGDEFLYFSARIANMLLGCLFLYLVIRIAKELFEKVYLRYIFVSIIMLWNYTSYIFTYVNCDATMMIGVAIIILALLKGMKSMWCIYDCLLLGLGNGLIILSYINGGGYSIVSVIVFITSYIFLIKKEHKYFDMIKKGIVISLEVFIMAGWFYIRNIILYGSLYGSNVSREIARSYGISNLTSETRSQQAKESMFHLSGAVEWVKGQLISFCGKTVYKESMVLNYIYLLLAIIVIGLLLIGLGKTLKEWKTYDVKNKIFIIGMLLGMVITFAIDFYYSAFVDYIPYYARYLLPLIISLGYFLTQGILWIDLKFKNKVIRKYWIFITLLLLIINIVTLVI